MSDESQSSSGLRSHLPISSEHESSVRQGQGQPAIQPSADDYQTLVEAFTQAVWETNATGKVVVDSPGWRAYTGQTIDKWMSEGWVGGVHPDDRALALQQWQEAIRQTTRFNAEFRLITPEAGWRWTNVRAIPVLNPDGSVNKWLGVNIDISANRKAHETIRESEALLRTLIEHLPGGASFVVDTDLRYQLAGGEAIYKIGRTPGDFIGKTITDAVSHEMALEIEPLYRQALAGEPFAYEHQVYGHHYMSHGVPLRRRNGAIYAVLVVLYDITDQKRVEEQLRRANEADSFRFSLTDALRPLTDPLAIQAEATRVLGEHLGVSRVHYGEVEADGVHLAVHQDYTNGVIPLTGRFNMNDFGPALIEQLRTGRPLVMPDLADSDLLTQAQKDTYAELGILAQVGIPLVKGKKFEAVLSVHQSRPRAWTPAEVSLIDETAERTWAAVQQARTKDELRQTEERTLIAVEAAELGTWEWNLISGEVYWNEQHFQLLGIRPYKNPIRIDDFIRYVHPDDKQLVREEQERIMRDKTVYDVDFRIIRDTGEIRWLSSYGRVTAESTGKHTRVSGVIGDITDRQQAEQALRDSENRFRILVQNLPDYAIFTIDPNGIITEWTEGAQRVKGYTAEEVIGKHISMFFAPHDLEAGVLEREMAKAAQTGRAELERLSIRKGGEQFWVNEIATAIHNADGQLIGFTKISRDITRQRRSQEALRQSEERLQIILDSITDHALITTDTRTIIAGWNPGAQELFGFTAEEAIGQPIAIIFTPEDRAAGAPEKEAETARQQGRAADERYHQRKDGSRMYVSGVISPLFDADGQLMGYVKVARDLTQRKQMEQELRDADQRKDEFLAMLAHELRNPLAPIRSALQIMTLTGEENKGVAPAVTMMSRQVEHLVRLIDDLLDVSRISRGKVELRRERIELRAVVEQALEAANHEYKLRGRRLSVSLSASPIYVNGDATRLMQVVANLLTNGARYTHVNGHVWLNVKEIDGQAVVRVRDDGIGLAPDQLSNIFNLFVQVDTALDRSQGGLGLGLTLVKKLVEMHGGRVEAYSEGLGKGSEFIVSLPTVPQPDKVIQTSTVKANPQLTGRRILVVDDNQDAARTLSMLLKLKKHEAHPRFGGREAIEAAEKLRPEVILLDIGMPELDGYETCRLIREQPWGKNMVLIALTGYGQDEDRRRSKEAGFDGHLVKPVDLAKLTELLATLLPD